MCVDVVCRDLGCVVKHMFVLFVLGVVGSLYYVWNVCGVCAHKFVYVLVVEI